MKKNQMQVQINVDTSALREAFAASRVDTRVDMGDPKGSFSALSLAALSSVQLDTRALREALASFSSVRVDTRSLGRAFASFSSVRMDTGALEKAFASMKKVQSHRTLAQRAATRIVLSAGDEYLRSGMGLAEQFCNGQEKDLAMIAYAAIVSDLCDGAAKDVCDYARRRRMTAAGAGGRRSAVVARVAASLEKFAPLAAEVRRTGIAPAGYEDASATLAKAISQ